MKSIITALAFLLRCVVAAAAGAGPGSLVQELNAAHRAGLATSARDLRVDLPPNSNAATYWRKLAVLRRRRTDRSQSYLGEDLLYRVPFDSEELAAARRALKLRTDELQLIAQALGVRHCRFEHDWVKDAGYTPEFADVRAACRLLAMKSRLKLAEGRPMEAVRTALQCCAAGRQIAEEPTLSACLVASACEAIGVRELQRVLWVSGASLVAVRAVDAAVAPLCRNRSIAYVLRGEALMTIASSRTLVQKGPQSLDALWLGVDKDEDWGRMQRDPARWRSFMESNTAGILWLMRQAQPAMRLPTFRALPRLTQLAGDVARRARTDRRLKLAAIVAPVYAYGCASVGRSTADARVTRTGAAVLEWRTRHGRLPDRLTEAIQPVLADPFDGRPLRYRREGTGFVVYSVGKTGKFDGGRRGVNSAGTEVLFRWPIDLPFRR